MRRSRSSSGLNLCMRDNNMFRVDVFAWKFRWYRRHLYDASVQSWSWRAVHFLAGTSFQTIFLRVISVANIAKTSSSTCTWVLRASYNQRSLRCIWYSLTSYAESDGRVLHGSIPFRFLTSAEDLCWYLLVVCKWSMVFVTFECTALLITVQTPQPSTLSLLPLKSCWIKISCSSESALYPER